VSFQTQAFEWFAFKQNVSNMITRLDGRQVRVNKAEEKAPRSGGGRGGFGGGSNNWRN
jgi:hypothetical protein